MYVGLDEEVGLHTQGGNSRRIARSVNSDEQHAIFTHELQSALRLKEGFLNINCEL